MKIIGIGIDADIHLKEELFEDLKKIELIYAIPWTLTLVYRENTVNDDIISRLKGICCGI
ncbi:hypothetical protein [uncultured Catenibacterium sp.]|uniref:hypothetical protein n=1 Tax=uncultured Catenibacterium sp. TaxID=286142 RepID=UPI0025E44127|nr:hypothetical protein [uncultured Catenibacterium sp.]